MNNTSENSQQGDDQYSDTVNRVPGSASKNANMNSDFFAPEKEGFGDGLRMSSNADNHPDSIQTSNIEKTSFDSAMKSSAGIGNIPRFKEHFMDQT